MSRVNSHTKAKQKSTPAGKEVESRSLHTKSPLKKKPEIQKNSAELELFHSFFDNHSAVMLLIDHDSGEIVRANRAAEKFYGYSAAQFKHLTTYEIIALSKTEIELEMKRAEALKRSYVLLSHRLASGEIREVEVHSSPIVYEGRNLRVAIVTDIAGRTRAEKSLRQRETEYRDLFDHVLDGVYRSTPDGRLLAVNPAMVQMLGYDSADELLQVDIPRDLYIDPKERQVFQRELGTSGDIRNIQIHLRRRDGSEITALDSAHAVCDDQGQIVYYEGTLTDITEMRQIEDALRRHVTELELLYENSLTTSMTLEPREIARQLIHLIDQKMHWHHAAIRYFNRETSRLELLALNIPDKDKEYIHQEEERLNRMISRSGQGLSGWVIQTGETVRSGSVQDDPRYADTYPGLQSGLYVPMKVGERVIGSIAVESESPNAFDESDERLLVTLAAQAAVAIDNARLFIELQERASEFEVLYETTRDLMTFKDIHSLLNVVAERATKLLNVTGSGIYLYDSQTDELELVSLPDASAKLGTRLKMGEGISGRVAQTRQPLTVGNYSQWEGRSRQYDGIRYHSVLGVPMIYGGELVGVLNAYGYSSKMEQAPLPRAFSEADIRLVSLFASAAAGAVYSARLLDQANRRAEEFEALVQASASLTSTLELQPLLENVVSAAQRAIPAGEKGTVLLWHKRTKTLRVRAQRGYSDPRLLESSFDQSQGYVGLSFREKRPILIANAQVGFEFPFGDQLPEVNEIQSGIVAPLSVKGATIGLISLDNASRTNAFTESDLHLLEAFAQEAAAAIENARLYEEAQRRANELGALAQVSSALRSASTRVQMMPVVLDQLLDILPADGAAILLIQPTTGDLLVELGLGSLSALTAQVVPAGQGIDADIIKSRQPYSTSNIQEDRRLLPLNGLEEARAAVIVPLIAQDRVLGVIWVARSVREDGLLPRPFSEDQQRLLMAVTDMAANAIHRASLHEKTALHADQMTGVSRLGRLLAETTDLNTLYKRLAEGIHDLLPDVCGLFISLYESEAQIVRCVCAHVNHTFIDISELDPLPFLPSDGGKQNRVIDSRQPLIVDEINEPFNRSTRPLGGPDRRARSALYMPMLMDGKVIGVIEVQSYTPARFSQNDLELLTLVSNTAAVEIENARLIARYERHVQRLTSLHTIDTAINSSTDMRLSLRVVLEQAVHLLDVDAASVLLLNPITLNLDFVVGSGFRFSKAAHATLRLGEGLAGKAALQRTWIQSADPEAILKCFTPGQVDQEHFQSYIGLPLVSKGKVSGVLQLFSRNPMQADQEWLDFLNVLGNQVALAVNNAHLFDELEHANMELTMAYDATIEGWSRTLDLRDHDTEGHTQRVATLTQALAQIMRIPEQALSNIRRGALLHDIGKMGIPDEILHKPGDLTAQEWDIMRQHPRLAYDLLSPIIYLRAALDIPYCHHEKWDGSGYPQGLKGESIPLSARIFAIVDVYDALTSDRPYRPAWTREKALDHIQQQADKHFDPQVVEAFMRLMKDHPELDGPGK